MPLTTYTAGDVLTAASLNDNFTFAADNPPGGLELLTAAAFSTITSFSLPNNTFDATYRNYKFIVNISAVSSNAAFTLRARAAGSDKTGGIYEHMFVGVASSGAASNSTATGATSLPVGENNSSAVGYGLQFDVICPQVNGIRTQVLGQYVFINQANNATIARNGGLWLNDSGSIDSLTFISSVASSITGTFRVYGYLDS